jgi:signal transduction histidine kinase
MRSLAERGVRVAETSSRMVPAMKPVTPWILPLPRNRRLAAGVLTLAAVLLIGWIDFLADSQVLLTFLYVLPIGYATVYAGRTYAILLAVLSVALWTGGDVLAGAPSPGLPIRIWNDAIVLSIFIIVIHLLDALHRTLVGLEATVNERTRELRREMEERRRLEHQTLDLSERERQAFGHELHDVVCQDLTSIAIAGHLLARRLEARASPETGHAREIASMVDQALTKARSVARGFFTAGFDVSGLAESLRETARNVQERTGVECEVVWPETLVIENEDVVMHFFRIAQEAVQNATKHAGATRIEVMLKREAGSVELTIEDNGKGMELLEKSRQGLGIRIMKYRASLIGGEIHLTRPASGGTRVACVIPEERIARKTEVHQ